MFMRRPSSAWSTAASTAGKSRVMTRASSSHRGRQRRQVLAPPDRLGQLLGGPGEQPADPVGERVDRFAGVLDGDLRREQQVGGDRDGGPDERLGHALPRGRSGRQGADTEHEHRADGDLDEVGLQPQHLPHGQRDEDEQAQRPPLQRHQGGEADGDRDARDDGDHPVQTARQQRGGRDLDDQHRRQRRQQRLGLGEDQRGDHVAEHRRDRQPQRELELAERGQPEPAPGSAQRSLARRGHVPHLAREPWPVVESDLGVRCGGMRG